MLKHQTDTVYSAHYAVASDVPFSAVCTFPQM